METHELYDGQVLLEFDAGKHRYTARLKTDNPPGRWVPSATGITGLMDNDKSGRLMGWAVKMAAEYLTEHLLVERDGIFYLDGSKRVPLDEVSKLRLVQSMKSAHRKGKQAAADVGTLVHAWVEEYIGWRLAGSKKGKRPKTPVNESVLSGVKAFLGWEKEHEVDYVYSERKVYSLAHHYAGTADIVARVNGKLTLVDIKTSNYMNDEFWLQTAAYVQALEEEFEEKFHDRVVVRLDKVSGQFDPHSALAEGKKFDDDIAAFLGLRKAYAWAKGENR